MSVFFLSCLTYLGVALPGSTLGILWPSMRLSIHEPVGALGIILVAGVAASVASSAITGRILPRFPVGWLLAAGAALVAGYGPVALSVWPGPLRVDPWKVPAGGITPTVIAVLVVLMTMLVTRQAAFVRGLMTSATDTARRSGIPGR